MQAQKLSARVTMPEAARVTVRETARVTVPEDLSRLVVLDSIDYTTERAVRLIRDDCVVLRRNVAADQVDNMLREVCEELGLLDRLRAQVSFAEKVNRSRVGDYRMTVTRRGDYQFITPHSEGDSQINVQLSSFYCYENTTDGGESIFLNVDSTSDIWCALREKVVRISRNSRQPTPLELRRARNLYRLRPSAFVLDDDEVVNERECDIPGILLADVFARPKRTRSCILGQDRYAYWASIALNDMDSLNAYVTLLKDCNLLRRPDDSMRLEDMDLAFSHRTWSTGVDHNRMFKGRINHKLEAGDFVLFNNITWAHAACSWTPGAGVRNVAAGFA